MSTPMLMGCVAAAVCLGIPVLAAGSYLATAQRVAGAADAAALAAADAMSGWLEAEPCEAVQAVAHEAGAAVARCELDATSSDAKIVLSVQTPAGEITARARAGGVAPDSVSSGQWVWPATGRGVTQGFHDGFAIDLNASNGSALLAPYDGVVVAVGPDGGGIPGPCLASPGWWRGENETVIVRHEFSGQTVYSSHNHVAPGSAASFGIAVGAEVRAGQPLAAVGMSGCTSGPHSHFTLSTLAGNWSPDLNPYAFIGPP